MEPDEVYSREPAFPQLDHCERTSDPSRVCNCVAWALGDNSRWWWPERGCYWPTDAAGGVVMRTFDAAFTAMGWSTCTTGDLEVGTEKLAVYERNGEPTHVARQVGNGLWTSKLGHDIDLSHSLDKLEGGSYGAVSRYYSRPASVPA